METCDVCKLEFPSSKPNEAVMDAPIAGSTWGYVCRAHLGNANKKIGTWLPGHEPKSKKKAKSNDWGGGVPGL